MDKTKQHKKKKVGALIAAIVVCLIVVIYAAFYVAGILISGMSGSLPTIILIIIGVLALAVIGGCIVGVRYGSSAVMQGAAEVVAYGTAVKFK